MQANTKNPFLALLPISFSFTRKLHIFSPFSSLKSRNGSCSLYLFFIKAHSNAGFEHPVSQFKREMNYIVAWMSRKAFIIGHGPFRLRMKTYFWSSLNYLGSYRESQERELQEPSRCMFRVDTWILHFVKEELRYCPYLRIYRIYPSCYHIYAWYKPFYTQKERKIAVNNRWLTDSSVVCEKLKVKEEIKILEDYCYDLRQSRMDSRWSHLTTLERCNVSSLAWYLPKPGSVVGRKDQKGEKRRKYNSKNWRGKRAEWWTLSPPQTTALASLADFFFLPPQELLNLRADDN